jgi:hypothetical protein
VPAQVQLVQVQLDPLDGRAIEALPLGGAEPVVIGADLLGAAVGHGEPILTRAA